MKIALEPFARSCIESSFGQDLSAGTQAAIRHYARSLKSQRQPPALPPFGLAPELEPSPGAELELAVPPEVEGTLTAEAQRQEVPVERIVAHAVFVYFADLDASTAEGGPKEEVATARLSAHAHPRTQAASSRRSPIARPARGRGCDGARAGGGSGLGAS